MEILLLRYSDDGDSTMGLLFIDGKFECHTLEDEHRDVKKPGETRIPEGKYKVNFRNERTPLTKKYAAKYAWFTYHLEIQEVLGFDFIYFHVGNVDEDTAGCVLLGNVSHSNNRGLGRIQDSTYAFKAFYKKVGRAIRNGEEVNLLIVNIE